MGNLATLLVKFGAAFLLACHANYSLAQDNSSGKRLVGSRVFMSRVTQCRASRAHVGHTQPDVPLVNYTGMADYANDRYSQNFTWGKKVQNIKYDFFEKTDFKHRLINSVIFKFGSFYLLLASAAVQV